MIVPVGGTWSQSSRERDWWRPDSVWVANLRNAELALLDGAEPFEWSSALAISDHDPAWRTAGLALKWYVDARLDQETAATMELRLGRPPSVELVAHSHGGQVVAHALAAGLRVKRVVTVGTPVRLDVADEWARGRVNIAQDWTHIWTEEVVRPFDPDAQPYQLLGSLPSGLPSISGLYDIPRVFDAATRNIKIEPPTTHHGLMFGPLWNEHDLWQYLR